MQGVFCQVSLHGKDDCTSEQTQHAGCTAFSHVLGAALAQSHVRFDIAWLDIALSLISFTTSIILYLAAILCPRDAYRIIINTRRPAHACPGLVQVTTYVTSDTVFQIDMRLHTTPSNIMYLC